MEKLQIENASGDKKEIRGSITRLIHQNPMNHLLENLQGSGILWLAHRKIVFEIVESSMCLFVWGYSCSIKGFEAQLQHQEIPKTQKSKLRCVRFSRRQLAPSQINQGFCFGS